MNNQPDHQFDSHFESALHSAVSGVQDELLDLDVPNFVPTPNRRPALGVLLALVLLGSVGLLVSRGSQTLQVETPMADLSESERSTSVETGDKQEPIRISEAFVDGVEISQVTSNSPGEFTMPIAPSWNADGSLFLLYRTVEGKGGRHVLYDSETFEVVRELSIDPSDIEEVFWSPVDPNALYYFDDDSLRSYDVEAAIERWVTTFEDCSDIRLSASAFSWDGQTFGFSCVRPTGDRMVMRYELAGSLRGVPATGSLSPPVLLASGDGLVVTRPVEGRDGLELVVLDAQLQETGITIAVGEDPFLATTTADGSDVLIGTAFEGEFVGTVVAINPWTGEQSTLVGPDTGFSYPPSGTYLSVQNWQAPGRIAIGVLGDPTTNLGTENEVDYAAGATSRLVPDGSDQLGGRVLLIDLGDRGASGSETVVRSLAFHHSSGQTDSDDYWAAAFVAMDPTGSKLLFSSDGGTGTHVDTYLIESP